MVNGPLELFYSYSQADVTLRDQLEVHLSLLKRQGFINQWHDRKVLPGSVREKDVDAHLEAANIILLLVSPDFIASDYCYGIEMQEALKRHRANEARVIPILLRQCDWETAPFGDIEALPRNAKPVKMWSKRDEAFTDIVKGIRTIVYEMSGIKELDDEEVLDSRKKHTKGEQGGRRRMVRTPLDIDKALLKKVTSHYCIELKRYQEVANYRVGFTCSLSKYVVCGCQLLWLVLGP